MNKNGKKTDLKKKKRKEQVIIYADKSGRVWKEVIL